MDSNCNGPVTKGADVSLMISEQTVEQIGYFWLRYGQFHIPYLKLKIQSQCHDEKVKIMAKVNPNDHI